MLPSSARSPGWEMLALPAQNPILPVISAGGGLGVDSGCCLHSELAVRLAVIYTQV